jgi:hypothetical protein
MFPRNLGVQDFLQDFHFPQADSPSLGITPETE